MASAKFPVINNPIKVFLNFNKDNEMNSLLNNAKT